MHAVDSSDPNHPRYRYSIDIAGAQISVYARSLATVLRVEGDIDAFNAADIAATIRRFTSSRSPVIIDLSHLNFLGLDGFKVLLALQHEQHSAKMYCGIVTGLAMRPVLRIVTDHGLPLVKSIPEAVQLLEDAFAARRQHLRPIVR